jgi:hypothetical protein
LVITEVTAISYIEVVCKLKTLPCYQEFYNSSDFVNSIRKNDKIEKRKVHFSGYCTKRNQNPSKILDSKVGFRVIYYFLIYFNYRFNADK